MASDRSDRDVILRRRRLLLASTIAGVAALGCDSPRPCLSYRPAEPDATVAPLECLTAPPREEDAGQGGPSAVELDAGSDAPRVRNAATARPCLEVPVPRPR